MIFATRRRALSSVSLCLLWLCTSFLAGCGRSNGLVGKWHGSLGSTPGATATADVEYKADGTAVSTLKSPQQEMTMTSTYSRQGDVLTETVKDISINGRVVPIPPTAKTTETRTIKVDAHTLTITDARRPGHLTLTRVP